MKTKFRILCRSAAAMLLAGTMFGMSCNADSVRAILAGIDAVNSSLDRNDDDIDLGDWLSSELDDL